MILQLHRSSFGGHPLKASGRRITCFTWRVQIFLQTIFWSCPTSYSSKNLCLSSIMDSMAKDGRSFCINNIIKLIKWIIAQLNHTCCCFHHRSLAILGSFISPLYPTLYVIAENLLFQLRGTYFSIIFWDQ